MAFDFKQDLAEFRGQEMATPEVIGSQVDVPSFNDDLLAYKNEKSPITAMLGAKQPVVDKISQKQQELENMVASLPDPRDQEAVHVSNAPKTETLTPTANIEIDYANRDLSREDIKAVPPGTVGGHCGVYAQNVVKLPGGGNWVVGDTIQQKTQSVDRYRNAGLAFKPGEDAPQAGNTVIINPGTKWGHVAVINEINEDGTATLTESNWNWDKRVTHDRKVRLDDPSIVGFIRTQ